MVPSPHLLRSFSVSSHRGADRRWTGHGLCCDPEPKGKIKDVGTRLYCWKRCLLLLLRSLGQIFPLKIRYLPETSYSPLCLNYNLQTLVVEVVPFTASGYALAGTPKPSLIVPEAFVSASTVAGCPIASRPSFDGAFYSFVLSCL